MKKAILVPLSIILIILFVASCANLKIGERKVVLSFPEDGSTDVELKPVLVWNFVAPFVLGEVKYDLCLSTDSKFSSPYKEGLTAASYMVEKPLSPNTTYYWKVIAKVGGEIIKSETWSFTTVNDSPPQAPELVSPENNTTVPLTVNFEWSQSADPDGDIVVYDLYIATDNTFSDPISMLGIESTGISLTLYPNTTYFWKVKAVDEKGLETESVIYTFKTKDAPPIKPIAVYPEDGQDDVATPVKLIWYSEDPESSPLVYDVYFGESPDSLNVATKNISEDRYEITQDLKSGMDYYWRVIAIDPSSNTSESDIYTFRVK